MRHEDSMTGIKGGGGAPGEAPGLHAGPSRAQERRATRLLGPLGHIPTASCCPCIYNDIQVLRTRQVGAPYPSGSLWLGFLFLSGRSRRRR